MEAKLAAKLRAEFEEDVRNENTFTESEFAAAMQLSRSAAKIRIRKLHAAGKIRPVRLRLRDLRGTVQTHRAWEYIADGSRSGTETP